MATSHDQHAIMSATIPITMRSTMPLLPINTLRTKCQNLDNHDNKTMKLDSRLHPIREDAAASYLKTIIQVQSYYEPRLYLVKESIVNVLNAPSLQARCLTQLLKGEFVDLYHRESGGFGWVQNLRDGYVGYVQIAHLVPAQENESAQSHEVMIMSPKTFSYAEPDLKSLPTGELYLGSIISGTKTTNGYLETESGFITEKHLTNGQFLNGDWLKTMLSFLGVPYLWGGKSFSGIDCSGLVQVVLNAYGIECPRDSDQQAATLGQKLDPQDTLQRGDFVFFKGHVGIMIDAEQLLHANQTAMAVTIDPLSFVESVAGPITCCRRLNH